MDNRILTVPERLIKKYGTNDPFKIARMLSIKIIFIDTKKQKGFCKVLLNNLFIFINKNMSRQMQRMTCAHELGHLMLHRNALRREVFIAEMELFNITDRRELEANQFAASLLIDDEELLQILQDGYDVLTAARMLDVNVNMLLVKLITMNNSGYCFDLPFNPKAAFMGTIEDSTEE